MHTKRRLLLPNIDNLKSEILSLKNNIKMNARDSSFFNEAYDNASNNNPYPPSIGQVLFCSLLLVDQRLSAYCNDAKNNEESLIKANSLSNKQFELLVGFCNNVDKNNLPGNIKLSSGVVAGGLFGWKAGLLNGIVQNMKVKYPSKENEKILFYSYFDTLVDNFFDYIYENNKNL